MNRVLAGTYFEGPAQVLARAMIGAKIVRSLPQGDLEFVISEIEAYLGPHDLACHSARGRTARTEILFGQPGTLYIYRIYGLHLMLNIVVGTRGSGAAVLVRSAGGIKGPGRLGKALDLTMGFNGMPAEPATGLWFESGDDVSRDISALARVGVGSAGPNWSNRKLRFLQVGSSR